ncbi:MAG: hypothetical protein HQK54_18680, partial [Oligoflexales bacterium]|nr:hypothetical protein [Oligoflexales bacterium]
MTKEIPITPGTGLPIEHMNIGRLKFLEGNYLGAKEIWLTGRGTYGKDYEYHRRNDYFIAMALFKLALDETVEKRKRFGMDNTATFLSWAFQNKKDLKDSFLDMVAAKAYYNLAAIFYNHQSYAAAYGAATDGMNFLRETGRSEYRTELRRILVESYIENRNYFEAISELDAGLRQDVDRRQAAAMLARAADIYFDLNNYVLAEDLYSLANKVSYEDEDVVPIRFVLRGESLFWLGRFSEAQKMFDYALSGVYGAGEEGELSYEYASIASIRIADAWLARGDYEKMQAKKSYYFRIKQHQNESPDWNMKIEKARKEYEKEREPFEKAKLGYFRHITDFRGYKENRTVDYAKIRLACLELPEYEGNNIRHARELLRSIRPIKNKKQIDKTEKDKSENDEEVIKPNEKEANRESLNLEAIHLAWACEVASYAQHERTPEMVEKVREFAEEYPRSRFLKDLKGAVISVQGSKLEEYFSKGEIYLAVDFFEKNRNTLFKNLTSSERRKLFSAYVDLNMSEKAVEFWDGFKDLEETDEAALRKVVMVSEVATGSSDKKWKQLNIRLSEIMQKRAWKDSASPKHRLFINRIVSTDEHEIHYKWMLNLEDFWAKKESKEYAVLCENTFILLSKMWESRDLPYAKL